MRRVDAVALPVDPLNQPVVAGSSDRVQPRRKATLKQKHWTLRSIMTVVDTDTARMGGVNICRLLRF